ncbi:MAG: DUF932 domain-containing protein [Candidatus Moraniibacteriota bacterium]
MAHEVETMFSAREVPWHGLGVITEDVLTAKDAIIAAGLDWDVELRNIYVASSDKKSKLILPGNHAVVRTSDDRVLGTVRSRYVPFQNRDAFAFADSLVDSGEAKYETAGALRDGRVVFLTMKVPTDIKIAGEDAHDLYVVLRTSHDGSKAIGVYVTPIRVVCMNTMTFAVNAAEQKWSMPHVSTVEGKLQEARETIRLTFDYADQFVVMGNQLVSTKITDDQLVALLEDVMPNRPKTADVIDQMMHLYRSSETNGYQGTAWGGLNAITEYFDHGRETRSQEAVFHNIMDGEIATIRNNAAQRLLTLV